MGQVATSGTAQVTLPADDQILITREFDAPAHLVFKAYTTPDLVRRWWAGKQGEMTTCEIDLREGGKWRYALVSKDGFEVAFNGEFREIVPNEKIVMTEVYEAMPDAGVVDHITFTEEDGRTTMSMLIQHDNKEHRDAHLNSGMETGMQEGMDLLEQVAQSLADG
jgi:uncharacterized protein YndB with AHSA1/START domain